MNIRADSHQSVSACQLDAYSNTNSSSGLLLFFFILSSPTLSWMKVQSNETLLSFTLHHVTSTTIVMNWEDKRNVEMASNLGAKRQEGTRTYSLSSFLSPSSSFHTNIFSYFLAKAPHCRGENTSCDPVKRKMTVT